MTSIKIQFFKATVITCAKYAYEVLNNDLSRMGGGGCGGRKIQYKSNDHGSGCSSNNKPILTIDDLYNAFSEMEGFESEIYNHDNEKELYYRKLNDVFEIMELDVAIDDRSVEYQKSLYSNIIAIDGDIISMGRIPEVSEIIKAINSGEKIL
ncbi:MAG: hypothetical protein GY756_23865 [bacterium]|nr:hypothetical protein [bacterium]